MCDIVTHTHTHTHTHKDFHIHTPYLPTQPLHPGSRDKLCGISEVCVVVDPTALHGGHDQVPGQGQAVS